MSETKKSPKRIERSKPATKRPDGSSLYVKFLLADEFRPEQTSGKVLAIGLYPDAIVIANTSIGTPEPTKDKPIGIDSLSMLFTIGGGVGEFDVTIKIGDNIAASTKVSLQEGRSASIVLQSKPFLVASYGEKQVVVSVAGKDHVFKLEIRHAVSPAVAPGSQELLAPSL